MADLSPAEILLDSLVPAQRLIKRLQDLLKAPVSYGSIRLSPEAKAARAAFQSVVQHDLDKLIAQREKGVALVKLIPDTTARTVIKLRYGLVGSGCEKMPWLDMEELMNYGRHSIFRYHRKGVDQLNQILENGS